MTRAEQHPRILRIIEEGQPATTAGGASPVQRTSAKAPRRLRVRVTDLRSGKQKLDISMPWSLVGVGMTLGARFAPPQVGVDFGQVLRSAEDGALGKLVDVVDDEAQEHVEILAE